MNGVNDVLVTVTMVVLAISGLLTLVRVVRGPSVLDRAIAMEVIVFLVVAAVGLEAAANRHSTTLPILVSLSLLGFTGSVAIARYVGRDVDPGETPVPAEVAREETRTQRPPDEELRSDEGDGR